MKWYGRKYIAPKVFGEQTSSLIRLAELEKILDEPIEYIDVHDAHTKEKAIIMGILKAEELQIVKGATQIGIPSHDHIKTYR